MFLYHILTVPLCLRSVPLYRHPADEPPTLVPYTPTAARIRDIVEKQLRDFGILSESTASELDGNEDTKEKPILNHALVQLYRNGTDYISEHADKTIDIVHDTPIIRQERQLTCLCNAIS